MKDFLQKCIVNRSSNLRDTMAILNNGLQIALVLDDFGRLLGTVTDGDIRRALLSGRSLDDNISLVMNANPICVKATEPEKNFQRMMRNNHIRHIPVLDNQGVVVDLEVINEEVKKQKHENMVCIMAGGFGKRLKNLTREVPKPLLKVGGKPILQIIIENFLEQGFSKFVISLGYKGNLIKEYFKDGSEFECEISYTFEDKPLGTAGALSLIHEKQSLPFLIMNGDILTEISFSSLIDFHVRNSSYATMCVREKDYICPYGVVDIKDDRIISIVEKPKNIFRINAGIYVLEPMCIQYIPKSTYFDMPSLFNLLINDNKKTVAFPLHEYWVDIGRPEDFENVGKEYGVIV